MHERIDSSEKHGLLFYLLGSIGAAAAGQESLQLLRWRHRGVLYVNHDGAAGTPLN